ncbi:MAG: signal peptidase I [Verrucomicrobiota bacterium]|nr:signal peptidase I [Verrucomicrobiota bacterium]
MNIYIILLNLLLFVYFPLRFIYKHFLRSPQKKYKETLKHIVSQIQHHINLDEDLYSENELTNLQKLKTKGETLRNSEKLDLKETDTYISKTTKCLNALPSLRKSFIGENLEMIMVAMAIAFSFRALFLQPFKIPTGSMQPTLFGIHVTETEKEPGLIKKFFRYINFSERYVDMNAKQEGYMYPPHPQEARAEIKNPFFFFPVAKQPIYILDKSIDTKRTNKDAKINVETVFYKVPGTGKNIIQKLRNMYPHESYFKKNQRLLRGYHTLGDHLFVDRLTFNFRDPRRGDVTVFITDGLGPHMAGRYYIKRLVGLPGDTLRITNHKLYVKPDGKKSFILMDGKIHPGFERMYSFKGGYKGYCYAEGQEATYLTDPDDTITLEKDEYFLMGDNNENSRDCRYFGPIPRKNIVGKAFFTFWPFSRRWGIVDKTEPDNFQSLPTRK